MKVVITGPTGEIGLALINLLIEKRIEVLAICRPDSHRRKYIPKSNYVKIVECELSKLESLQSICDSYDVFFHFGWAASYGEGRDDLLIQNANVLYEKKAIELAKHLKCKRFIMAGSQAEYGRKMLPINEKTLPCPETYYGAAKLSAEHYGEILCKKYRMEHVCVRVCSVYGPADGPYTLLTYIMNQIYNNRDINVTKCEQIWDYLYSKDAALAFYLIAEAREVNNLYVLGSGKAAPLKDYMMIVQQFAKDLGKTLKVNIGAKDYSDNQMMYLCADIGKLKKDMRFEPAYSFYEGIKETYEWYSEQNLNYARSN